MPLKHSIPFLALATIPLLVRSGASGCWLLLLSLLTIFIGLDLALGEDAGDRPAAGNSLAYRCLPWLYIILQLAVILWGAAAASRAAGVANILALAVTIGAVAGVFGMLAAHEMIHARHPAERALGLAMLAALGYMHFQISHLRGHHRLAATAADPATARRGESAYRFLLRSIAGQWRQAWRCESRRLVRQRRPLAAHRLLHYAALQATIVLALGLGLGGRALLYQAAMCGMAVVILELFNYVAHYGLLRRVLPDGSLEKLGPQHSWNVRRRFDNWALFNGGRHSDHHRAPARRYHRLVAVPGAPLLPMGYAGSLCLALIPPLWRRVMDAALSPGASSAAPSPPPPAAARPAAGRAA